MRTISGSSFGKGYVLWARNFAGSEAERLSLYLAELLVTELRSRNTTGGELLNHKGFAGIQPLISFIFYFFYLFLFSSFSCAGNSIRGLLF